MESGGARRECGKLPENANYSGKGAKIFERKWSYLFALRVTGLLINRYALEVIEVGDIENTQILEGINTAKIHEVSTVFTQIEYYFAVIPNMKTKTNITFILVALLF